MGGAVLYPSLHVRAQGGFGFAVALSFYGGDLEREHGDGMGWVGGPEVGNAVGVFEGGKEKAAAFSFSLLLLMSGGAQAALTGESILLSFLGETAGPTPFLELQW